MSLRIRISGILALTLIAVLAGCGKSYEDVRPNPSNLNVDDRGLQSKDLIEMTDKMAPDLLKIPEIVQNPNKIVIVMTGIDNHLSSDPTRDLTIYTARLRTLLNEHARDRLAFVEKHATLTNLQNQELGSPDTFEQGSRGAGQPDARLLPQFALKGEFYDMPNTKDVYYLCTFQLTNLRTGELIWEGHYEVKTLN